MNISCLFKLEATTPQKVIHATAVEVSNAYKAKTKNDKYTPIQKDAKTVILKRIK